MTCDYRLSSLRASPEIHRRDAVHAADGAVRRARLRRAELAADVVDGIGFEGNGRIAPLLGAVVHQAVLADIEVTRAGPAAPFVRIAVGEVVLEAADARVEVLQHLAGTVDGGRDVVVDLALHRAERLQPAGAVVDDPD